MNLVKIKDAIKQQKKMAFHEMINLWTFTDNTIVGVDLQMSQGIEINDLPDTLLMDGKDLEGYIRALRNVLHSIPEKTTITLSVQTREGDKGKLDSYEAANGNNNDPISNSIINEKIRSLKAKYTHRRKFFLFVTTYHKDEKEIPNDILWKIKDRDYSDLTERLHNRRVRNLNSIVKSIQDSLISLGIKSRLLEDYDNAEYYYRHINPTSSNNIKRPHIKKRDMDSDITARSSMVMSASQNEYGHFLIDNIYHKSVNLYRLPDDISLNNIPQFFSNLWPDCDFNLTINVLDTEKCINRLKGEAKKTSALRYASFGSKYEADQKFFELDELIKEIRGTSQNLFSFSMSALFKDKNLTVLDEKVQNAVKSFQSLGSAIGIVENLNHEEMFLSFLPNNSHYNSRKHLIHSNAMAEFLPLSAPWNGTKNSKILFETPEGSLVGYDLFDDSLPAKHSILVGSTGNGKSFTANYLLLNFYIESINNHVVVIDIGGSYRKICDIFKGKYLNVDTSNEYALNPFPLKRDLFVDGKCDSDQLAYLTLILEKMVLDEKEVLNNSGEALLEKAILNAYSKYDLENGPQLADVRESLLLIRVDRESKDLANHYYKNLELWCDGRYGSIFNTRKRVDIDNRFVVFDLEKLKNHPKLQAIYFYVIRQIIDSKLSRKFLKKMIVIDEGWQFLDDEIGSRLIENLYRTARKSNAAIMTISQNPMEFFNSKISTAVLANSFIKYVLKLGKDHESLSKVGFNSSEIDAVKNLHTIPRKFADIFVKFDQKGCVLRLEPNNLEYSICTSDPNDLNKELEFKSNNPELTSFEVLQLLSDSMEKEKL